MATLPIQELITFCFVVFLYLVAAVIGIVELGAGGGRYRRFLPPIVSLAVVSEALILIFRAVAINGFPMTGLFGSMIVLTMVFGLMYLFFNIGINQVWFSSVMMWVILAMVVIAGVVAEPVAELREAATTPWAIAHGIAMVLAAAMLAFSTGMAILFLLSRRQLKNKQLGKLLGKMPSIGKLEELNISGLWHCWGLITFGLVSGFGMLSVKAAVTDASLAEWLIDSKVILVGAVWLLLGVVLLWRSLASLKGKTTAYITIAAFALILFAIVGTTIFCKTKHDFNIEPVEKIEEVIKV